MSWKCYQPHARAERSCQCAVCGRKFYTKAHHRLCNRCKRMVGKHRNIGSKKWSAK